MTAETSAILGTIGGIVLLVVSSFILTSTIEDLGKRGKFSSSFTGAIISPIFTSLPELIVILTALILVGNVSGSEIAAGTIIGEPFLVSAIGFPIMAIAMLAARRKGSGERLDAVMPKTMIFVGLVLPIMIIPSLFQSWPVRILIAAFLVIIYLLFARFVRQESLEESEFIVGEIRNRTALIFLIATGTVLLVAGSAILVRSVDNLAFQTGINRELIAILIIPIATIVPETLNSVIWGAKLKTNLAVGALLGEETFFATIYPMLAILASRWVITENGIVAIFLTSLFSIAIGLFTYKFRQNLYVYLVFVLSLIAFLLFIY